MNNDFFPSQSHAIRDKNYFVLCMMTIIIVTMMMMCFSSVCYVIKS